VTVLAVIQRSTAFLSRKGVDSPRLQAELLLAHVLKVERMRLYLNFNQALEAEQEESMRQLVKRRGQREPLQQIVGTTSFCGLEMAVNRHVLVPRPETELLAEAGRNFLDETSHGETVSVLDVGTGSGCLAIALASHCPKVRVVAIDVSPEALELAHQNAKRHGLAERIRFLQGDLFEPLGPSACRCPQDQPLKDVPDAFDLIITNPPYIPRTEIATLQPEVRDFEPAKALDGGLDGLDFYRRFASEGKAYLEPGGKIMLEFGDGQAEAVRRIFENEKWIVEAVLDDYTKRARILVAAKPDSVT
jgi:release factor glutamine methyltransferase